VSELLLLVTGTGTEVGKTWVAARLAASLGAEGVRVVARKPLQSFGPDEGPTDAEVLAAATGDDVERVCPPERSFPVPMAPPMAAAVLERTAPTVRELVDALTWPEDVDVALVESVGGVRAPLAADGDTRDLARELGPDLVVLVAEAGLGTIDRIRSATDSLADHRVVVFLNRFDRSDDLHHRNRAWLCNVDGLDVATSVDELLRRVRGTIARP